MAIATIRAPPAAPERSALDPSVRPRGGALAWAIRRKRPARVRILTAGSAKPHRKPMVREGGQVYIAG
jgi:hypothetical protein